MAKILDQIKSQLEKAVKEKDEKTVSCLRFLLANLHNEKIAKKEDLTDEEVVAVIRKQVKKHQESIEAFKKAERGELSQKEEAEKKILEVFLPAQMSEEEIRKAVNDVLSSGISDFGQAMGQAMGRLKGQADGSLVAEIVKEELQSS